ncbi:MAG: type II and III secretion system protein family protein [Alphaproteobacteria bacterium]
MKRLVFGMLVAAAVLLPAAAMAQEAAAVFDEEVVVREAGLGPVAVKLPLYKSRVVRLPVDVRDVIVSNAAVADVIMKSPRLAYVVGNSVGYTNVVFIDAYGEKIAGLDLDVELDVGSIERALVVAVPNEDITVTTASNNVILTGVVSSAVASENARLVARRFAPGDDNVVNLLTTRTQSQVLLKVRVSEMNRQILKQFGFDLAAEIRAGNTTLSFDQDSVVENAISAGGIAFLQGGDAAFQELSAIFDNLERGGLLKTLAEPSVTAVSGEAARILVGGEFPVPVAQTTDTITIEFKEFGIGLNFTPVVLDETQISLQVQTEVSQLSDQGAITLDNITVPALSVRRASTTVNLPSGGSLVIAGLLQNDIRNTINGFPGLKDVPVLGALFRSVDFQRDETELVVTVTPYLVKPIAEGAMSLPTDGFAPASDVDMYFLGRLHGVYAPTEPASSADGLEGPIGYILE